MAYVFSSSFGIPPVNSNDLYSWLFKFLEKENYYLKTFLVSFISERENGLALGDSQESLFNNSIGSGGGRSGDEDDDVSFGAGGLLSKRVFTNSQLSLVSASLE